MQTVEGNAEASPLVVSFRHHETLVTTAAKVWDACATLIEAAWGAELGQYHGKKGIQTY